MTTQATPTNRPLPQDAITPKQRDYLNRLISYRLQAEGVEVPTWHGYPAATPEQEVDCVSKLLDLPLTSLQELTRAQASKAIEGLKNN